MKKYFILNVVMNLAIAFIVYSGVMSYESGNQLFLFLSLAILVVLVYFKVVLIKQVRKEAQVQSQQPAKGSSKPMAKGKSTKKGA